MVLNFFVALLPWPIKRIILKYLYKYDLGVNCYIGLSYVFPKKMCLKDGARIGHLNVIKALEEVVLGEYSIISNLNWITSHPKQDNKFFKNYPDRRAVLILGEHAAITSRHLIDCTEFVMIGKFSTIAGFNSQILTHSIDLYKNEQSCKGVTIGDYCFIGTSCVILPGADISDYVIVGAKSLISGELSESESLYAGIPAIKIKNIANCEYFKRVIGEVV